MTLIFLDLHLTQLALFHICFGIYEIVSLFPGAHYYKMDPVSKSFRTRPNATNDFSRRLRAFSALLPSKTWKHGGIHCGHISYLCTQSTIKLLASLSRPSHHSGIRVLLSGAVTYSRILLLLKHVNLTTNQLPNNCDK